MDKGAPGEGLFERPYDDINAKDILGHRCILARIKLFLDGADPRRIHDMC